MPASPLPHEGAPPTGSLPRTNDRSYDLRQRLDRAVRWLREAEDIARVEMPAWPTADRIRSIYEQITEDVLRGSTARPPVMERLRNTERERDEAREEVERLSKINSGLVRDFNTLLVGGEVEVMNAEPLVVLVDKAMLAEGLHMTVRAKLRTRIREALGGE